MNDSERRDWVENDEGLYRWWKSYRMPLTKFIRENRKEVDAVIENITSNKRSTHYLLYG